MKDIRSAVQVRHVDRRFAGTICRVAMRHRTALVTDLRERSDVLQHADLVVRMHDRETSTMSVAQVARSNSRCHQTLAVRSQKLDLKTLLLQALADQQRFMFGAHADDDRLAVRFAMAHARCRRSRGSLDTVSPDVQIGCCGGRVYQRRDVRARLLDPCARFSSECMRCRVARTLPSRVGDAPWPSPRVLPPGWSRIVKVDLASAHS